MADALLPSGTQMTDTGAKNCGQQSPGGGSRILDLTYQLIKCMPRGPVAEEAASALWAEMRQVETPSMRKIVLTFLAWVIMFSSRKIDLNFRPRGLSELVYRESQLEISKLKINPFLISVEQKPSDESYEINFVRFFLKLAKSRRNLVNSTVTQRVKTSVFSKYQAPVEKWESTRPAWWK